MNVSVHPRELLDICNRLGRIPTKHPSFSFLDKVLIIADATSLSVRATNMTLAAELSTFATVDVPGKVLVDPIQLHSALSGIPDTVSAVVLRVDNNELSIKASGIEISLPTYVSDDFPLMPAVDGDIVCSVPGSTFANSLKRVAFAASNSDIKPELASVYTQFQSSQLITVATDGFRLAEYSESVDSKREIFCLISAKYIADVARLLDVPVPVEIIISESMMLCNCSGMMLVIRLTTGNYPDYRQIIPQESITTVTLLKDDILRACRTVAGFTDQFTKIDVTVNPNTGEMTVNAPRSEKGAGMVTLPATITGEDITMRMSAKNIMDALSVIDDASISFAFNGPSKPVTATGFHNHKALLLMMPMSR